MNRVLIAGGTGTVSGKRPSQFLRRPIDPEESSEDLVVPSEYRRRQILELPGDTRYLTQARSSPD